jgi:hypothetical protein
MEGMADFRSGPLQRNAVEVARLGNLGVPIIMIFRVNTMTVYKIQYTDGLGGKYIIHSVILAISHISFQYHVPL